MPYTGSRSANIKRDYSQYVFRIHAHQSTSTLDKQPRPPHSADQVSFNSRALSSGRDPACQLGLFTVGDRHRIEGRIDNLFPLGGCLNLSDQNEKGVIATKEHLVQKVSRMAAVSIPPDPGLSSGGLNVMPWLSEDDPGNPVNFSKVR